MTRPLIQMAAILACGMAGFVGCRDSAPTEPPAAPEEFVAEESAEPILRNEPNADPPSKAARSRDREPVDQAAHLEAVEETDASAPDSAESATVPQVLLTKQHEALCRIQVGDAMPEIELERVEGGRAELADLYGEAATVVVFWKNDRRMALDELADLGPDVVARFGRRGVAVVGIAVEETAADARAALREAGAEFPNLLDADGRAFAQVGAERLPWTLVLDADGRIVWFDLEYSHATRRELQQALLATVR